MNINFEEKYDFVTDYIYAQMDKNSADRIMIDNISERPGSYPVVKPVMTNEEIERIEALFQDADADWWKFTSWKHEKFNNGV